MYRVVFRDGTEVREDCLFQAMYLVAMNTGAKLFKVEEAAQMKYSELLQHLRYDCSSDILNDSTFCKSCRFNGDPQCQAKRAFAEMNKAGLLNVSALEIVPPKARKD